MVIMGLRAEENPFQFLIGRLVTDRSKGNYEGFSLFQFLIGRLVTQ